MAEIADLSARVKAADEAAAAAKRALAAASATLTAEQLAARIAANRAEGARLDARLDAARGAGGARAPSPAEVAAAEATFSKLLGEWGRRRRIFTSAWDAMSENLDAKAADLFEEIGIETDEAVGEALATYRALLPSAKRARA
jgi:26S proteasome regulatory subunit (ATPase 3-interacting protein)